MKPYQYNHNQNSGQTSPGLSLLQALFNDLSAPEAKGCWPVENDFHYAKII
jgi:hypothetical protein